jgi:hypothetical protein
MQLKISNSTRRWIWWATPFIAIGAIFLLWLALHRTPQSTVLMSHLHLSKFNKINQKIEFSDGSGNYPPQTTAYFVGPPGGITVDAPDFVVTSADLPTTLPDSKGTVIYTGDAPHDCQLIIDRLDPDVQLPSWVHLSNEQRSMFQSHSSQLLEVTVQCGG